MTDTILLPTDGESGVEQAIIHAIDLADIFDAELHALYVVDESIYGAYSGDEFVQDHEGPQATLEEAGEDALERIVEEAAASGVDVTTSMRYGRPAEEIVKEAEEIEADSIIMGTKSATQAYRSQVGSVTDDVLHLTDRSVTVVKTPVDIQ